MYDHIRIIIAHSSGEGLDKKHPDVFKALCHCHSKYVEVVNFNDIEAEVFLDLYGLNEVPASDIKQHTNWNPFLLQEVVVTHRRHWKSQYDDVFKAHFCASINRVIEDLTASTFNNLTEFSKLEAFSLRLTNTRFFLYSARTGLEMSI